MELALTAMIIIIVALIILLELQLINQRKEREDLLNRLMAKTTSDYVRLSTKDKEVKESKSDILGEDAYNPYVNGIIN